MRPRLIIPARLALTVTAAACSSAAPLTDASVDVAADHPSRDAIADVLADVFTDLGRDAPQDAAVADARECTRDPFDRENPAFAVRCRPRPGATQSCPEANVCVAADCPAHCEGCVSPLFCIPDPEADAGVACSGGTACSPEACPPGCRAVG